MRYNTKVVEEITKAPEKRIQEALIWYAKQPMETQIEAHALALDLYHQQKHRYPNNPREVQHATFVLSILKMMDTRNQMVQKVPDHDIQKIRKITNIIMDEFLIKHKHRKTPKRDTILAFMHEIEMMREKGYSWRLIGEFLRKKRKIKVHWTYIRRVYERVCNRSN